MNAQSLVVLGINGHIGHHVARAFQEAGWRVTGFGRSNRRPIHGVRFVAGDADDVEAMRDAIGDADVVFNGLNLPYHQWDRGRLEAQSARVLAALGASGKTLLFPGNIYNYAATDRIISPALSQRPQTPRGEIRKRVEAGIAAAAARGDIRAIILRAGDFFGPGSQGDWFDLVMLREAGKGRLSLMGQPGISHAWAYLPDLARAFEKLAWHRGEFGGLETFHFAGHYVTPEVLGQAIAAAAPVRLRIGYFPRILMSAMGLVSPMMREVAKMGYLWQHPMQLVDPRLEAILGPGFGTSLDSAVAATVGASFVPVRQAA